MPMPARWIWGLLLAHFCQCLRCLLQRSPDSDDEINLTKVGCHQKYAALEGRLFFPDSSGCSFDCFAGIGWLHEHASTLEECDVQNACAKSLCILHVLYMTIFSHRIRLYYICSHPKQTIHLKSLETFMHAFTCMFMVLGYFIKYCIERAAARILFANWGPPCRVLVENVNEWFSVFFLLYRCFLDWTNSACFVPDLVERNTYRKLLLYLGVQIHGFLTFFPSANPLMLGRVTCWHPGLVAFFLAIPVFMRALMKWIPGCPWWCLHQVWSDLLF